MTELGWATAGLGGVVGILVVGNVAQAFYWARVTNRLIDKIMSRNYAEFVQVERMRNEPSSNELEPSRMRGTDPVDDQEVLNELNGMFGLK